MVSVILPVLNGEKTIKRSIESVLKQTYIDFELIIVDNGSTDGTEAICKKFLKQDGRVKIFQCKTPGVVAGRNMGIANASGEYITFIDADDEYKENILEKLVFAIEKEEADIVTCGYEICNEKEILQVCVPSFNGIISTETYFAALFQCGTLGFLWNKLYRTSIWNDVRTPFGMEVCEDTYINCSLLLKDRIVVVIPESLYRYYENPISVTRSINKKIDQNGNWKYLDSYKKIKNLVEEDKQKKRCVEKGIWWIIKLGLEELNSVGENGKIAKKKLFSEMKKTIIPVIISSESLRFKISYIRTYILNSRI